jgi:hypothetical protein
VILLLRTIDRRPNPVGRWQIMRKLRHVYALIVFRSDLRALPETREPKR